MYDRFDPTERLRLINSNRSQRHKNGPEDPDAGGNPRTGNSSYDHMFGADQVLPEFPVDVFPRPIQRYIEDGSTVINVPLDMIAVPFLGFAAGVIGNTRTVIVKPGWSERVNLWLAVIGDPGTGKSPANDYARKPLDDLQNDAWERHQEELREWEQAVAEAKKAKGSAKEPPERPVLEHYFTTDATTEALTQILSTSPGVAVVRDELVGWVKSHDAYKKGGDRQNYLSLWAGAPLKVDRRGTSPLYVAHPCVPVIGGIQPDLLTDLGEEAQRRDGFVERILMSWPVARPIRWNDAPIDDSARRGATAIFRRLRVQGECSTIGLSHEARRAFGQWYEENGRIIEGSYGIAAGFYSKYPGQLARIALVLHALHYPADIHRQIDIETISDAIRVIEYFRAHLVRVLPSFAAMGTTKSAGLATRVLRILDKANGEWVARRELNRGLGNSVEAANLDEILNRLEGEGLVENRVVPTGARPRQESRILRTNEHMNNSPDDGINADGVAGDDRFTA